MEEVQLRSKVDKNKMVHLNFRLTTINTHGEGTFYPHTQLILTTTYTKIGLQLHYYAIFSS